VREVILARHGESEFSLRGAMNGDPAVACPLTASGEGQARALGAALRDTAIDLCAVTEFQRTQQTADLALEGRDVPRLVVPELNDIRVGEFEGGLLEAYRAWARERTPVEVPPGGGESRAEAAARYARGYRVVLARPERTILVVAHGLPIRYLLLAADGERPQPVIQSLEYAEPYRLTADQAARAVERLENWAAEPAWPEKPQTSDPAPGPRPRS
jgi:2,3-bisphosphoglycerate-dependent phosphoglycerate mutase